jgi:uncharacterized pyridoxamine 5'-phosphate oxidase family protein
MIKTEAYEMMNANLGFFLATCEDGQPHVRGMMLYRANEDGILFHTGTMKDVYVQIMKNPRVEMCFNDFKAGVQLRVAGKLEPVDDNVLKDEIAEHPTRGFVKAWREGGVFKDFYAEFVVFRMRGGRAAVWSMDRNFAPKETFEL